MEQYRVTFLPDKKTVTVDAQTTIWEAAQQLDLDGIDAVCGGVGLCGKCKVVIDQGHQEITDADRRFLSSSEMEQGYRLACQACIQSDLVVVLLKDQGKDEDSILDSGSRFRVDLEPGITKNYVSVPRPVLEDNPFDLKDLVQATGHPHLDVPLAVMRLLPERLRHQEYTGTAVYTADELIDFQSGDTRDRCYGVAVDLGTTTVVAKLLDLNTGSVIQVVSRLNRQRNFGEDVISRISYADSHADGLKRLHEMIVTQLNEMIEILADRAGIDRTDIYDMTVAGNTVMEHLLLAVSPKYLAELPYVPVFDRISTLRSTDLQLRIHPRARIFIFPIIGRYVGGDTSSVLLALSDRLDQTWLAVDIGTNGEMILCNKGELSCCSTAAGPAFEGAHIRQGMRAAAGAIERVGYDSGAFRIQTIGKAPATGICGSGLIDSVAALKQSGLLEFSGRLIGDDEIENDALRSLVSGSQQDRTVRFTGSDEQDVGLSQRDIREIQLAKGAVATGIQMLLDRAGLKADDLDALYLAGAFGQYILPACAQEIGLLPTLPLSKVVFIGNAAYTGAEMALLSAPTRDRCVELAATTEYVEISTDPDFQMLYAENMMF